MVDPVRAEVARADVYRLLSACFCSPEREVLLEEEVPEQLRQALAIVYPTAVEPAVRLGEALRQESQAELEIEHARLFVGPGPLLAPPFGSVYLDGERTVMGPSTLEVADLYREAGFGMGVDQSDPPDHIAAELEFACVLAQETARLLESGKHPIKDGIGALERRFVGNYLLPWVPSLCDDIAAHSDSEYFRSLAVVLKSFLVGSERLRLDSGSESHQ